MRTLVEYDLQYEKGEGENRRKKTTNGKTN